MSVPDSVYELVEKFDSGKARFKNPQYNETALRVEFINPLFEALGWNVRDSAQVSHEDRVMIEGKPKRPRLRLSYRWRDPLLPRNQEAVPQLEERSKSGISITPLWLVRQFAR